MPSIGHWDKPTPWLVFLLCTLCGLSQAAAASSLPYRPDSIIVKRKSRAGTVSAASIGPSSTLGQLAVLAVPEGKTAQEYIEELEARGEVEYAEPNYLIRLLGVPASDDPLLPQQYHLSLVNATGAWQTRTDASSVKVCVIDTGVDFSHPDLEENLAPESFNAVDELAGAEDEQGHGTQVAGVIGATGNNSLQGAGVAWRVQLLACKIFPNSSEVGDVQSARRCLQWCIDQGAQVSSNSWGLFQPGPAPRSLYDMIAAANAAGHVAVFAAGNDGVDLDDSGAKSYPTAFSDLPNLISVASTDREGGIAGLGGGPSHSNYGGKTVTIAAPGVDILTTANGGGMTSSSGTSFAAPQVVGAVALLQAEAKARGLSLQPCQYKALLVESAEQLPALEGKVQANGMLNVQRALEQLVAGDIPGCPPSPPPGPPVRAPAPGRPPQPAAPPLPPLAAASPPPSPSSPPPSPLPAMGVPPPSVPPPVVAATPPPPPAPTPLPPPPSGSPPAPAAGSPSPGLGSPPAGPPPLPAPAQSQPPPSPSGPPSSSSSPAPPPATPTSPTRLPTIVILPPPPPLPAGASPSQAGAPTPGPGRDTGRIELIQAVSWPPPPGSPLLGSTAPPLATGASRVRVGVTAVDPAPAPEYPFPIYLAEGDEAVAPAPEPAISSAAQAWEPSAAPPEASLAGDGWEGASAPVPPPPRRQLRS